MGRKTVIMRVSKDLKTLLDESNRLGLTRVERSKVLAEFAKTNGFPNMEMKIQKVRTRRKKKIVIKL